MFISKDQRGDTLIEVLLAMTVLAVVVAGGYMIANKSMKTNQQTQDRSQATKVMESQFERIKYASKDTDGTTASNTYRYFKDNVGHLGCFDKDLAKVDVCQSDDKYKTTVVYYNSEQKDATGAVISAPDVFKVSVVWSENGTDDRNVTGYYKVHDEKDVVVIGPIVPVVPPIIPPVVPPVVPPLDLCSNSGTNPPIKVGDYKIHIFTSSGTFMTTCDLKVDYLIIGGGGAGGAGNQNEGGGGGGAGGYIESTGYAYNVAANTALVPSYPVVVGSGGVGTTDNAASPIKGTRSTIFGFIALGGGGGASCWKDAAHTGPGFGGAGGSGGGGSGCSASGAGGAAKQIAPGFGSAGGPGQWSGAGGALNGCNGNAGGGGGAGGAGQSGGLRNIVCNGLAGSKGGAGAGKVSSITGNAITYAVGGNGAGGRSNYAGDNATANTGSGGGGSANGKLSGNGGTGIVIIKYKYK